MLRSIVLAALLLLAVAWPSVSGAQSAVPADHDSTCGCVCGVPCVKPWMAPDRWDDETSIPGYPEWRRNGLYDAETHDDQNGDRLWNPGEPFADLNGNGKFDSELYHPILTGYIALKDSGKNLLQRPAFPERRARLEHYYALDLDVTAGPDYGNAKYRWNIENCSQAYTQPGDFHLTRPGNHGPATYASVAALIALDPDAWWDGLTNTVRDSRYAISPRFFILPLSDPRMPLEGQRSTLLVRKLAGFFLEGADKDGTMRGRFTRIMTPGEPCRPGVTSGGFLLLSDENRLPVGDTGP